MFFLFVLCDVVTKASHRLKVGFLVNDKEAINLPGLSSWSATLTYSPIFVAHLSTFYTQHDAVEWRHVIDDLCVC